MENPITTKSNEQLLLIIPPNINFQDFVRPPENVKRSEKKSGQSFGSVITDPPLGSISLSAFVKKHLDIDIQIIDFNVELNKIEKFEYESFKDYFRAVLPNSVSIQPTIVGISTLFMTAYRSLIALAEIIKELYPNAFLIAGGNIPTVSYRQIYTDTKHFNAVCHGEGERPLVELLKCQDKQKFVESDPCWITEAKLSSGMNQFRNDVIEHLDEIPFNYSYIHLPDYELNPTINYYTSSEVRGKSFNIMTSRGCPFKCIFCASHRTHGRAMRYHSLERVKEDLLRLKNEYNIRTVTIEDDHFLGDKKRAFEIVKFLSEQDMTAFFPNALALFALDRPMLEGLQGAGLRQIVLAVESGSDRVLRYVMKKPLKLEYVTRVIKDCRDLGIYTDCNILIGLPGETKQDIADSRAFLKTTGANWFRINAATPIIGSEMHEICEKNGYIKKNLADSNYKKAIVETESFTHQFIQETIYDMNIELNFVFNSDMRLEKYEIAKKSFENVLKAKSDHALALHYLSICSEKLGDSELSSQYKKRCREAVSQDTSFWSKYIDTYNLKIA